VIAFLKKILQNEEARMTCDAKWRTEVVNPDASNMTMTEKVEAACKQAAAKVIERARQTGTPVILWENGLIVKRSWEELVDEPTNNPTDSPIEKP
jgi:hypothetical protein